MVPSPCILPAFAAETVAVRTTCAPSSAMQLPLTPDRLTVCINAGYVPFASAPLTPTRPSELSAKSFRDFWRQEFVCRLNVRHTTSSAFKNIQVRQVVKSRRYSSEPHGLSAGRAMRRCWRTFIREFVGHGQRSLEPRCLIAHLAPDPH